jgi:YD repeat-containing protein
MQLLIDADQNHATGWNGYDYVVNSKVLTDQKTTLKRLSDGKTWTVSYHAQGNEMAVVIPRRLLGLTDLKTTTFDFHWADNVTVGGDPATIADWWYNGDSAPDGRFNYRCTNLAAGR